MPAIPDTPLTEQDVRDTVRLLGHVVTAGGGLSDKRRLLMDGLCGILRADAWFCSLAGAAGPRIEQGGRAAEMPVPRLPGPDAPGACRPWADGVLLTTRLPGASASLGIFSRGGFGERDKLLLELIIGEVPWLLLEQLPASGPAPLVKLPPRLRSVFDLLCSGCSRKHIASQLGVSINTVHGYSRVIFKNFGVHSQAELISQLQSAGESH